MRKTQAGQAFILVLIVLAIGAVLVVPSLRLTSTALMGTPTVERHTKGLYAADAATEYILWKLAYDNLGQEFTVDGQSAHFEFDVCDVPVSVTIVMRATEGQGGITLATDDLIKPTKTVDLEGLGGVIPDDWSGTVTYTIRLEQLSNDTSQGLDAVYDVLPKVFGEFNYVTGSSQLRVDGGAWVDFPEPSSVTALGQLRLRWPASGDFTSPMRDFEVRQVKEIRFELTHEFKGDDKDRVFYNWVLLKLGDIDTLSGPQAPITVGDGTNPEGGLLETSKTANPEIIQPGVETPVEYTIIINNLDDETHHIQEITDYLPPGFAYSTNIGPPAEPEPYAVYHPDSTLPSGITTSNPNEITILTKEGVEDRYRLYWEFSPAVSIASGETLTLTFWALASREVSGSYYNEFIVIPNTPIPSVFQPPDMNVTYDDFNTTYSWNSGAVIVPAYDTSSDAEGITINSNMALILGGITITSWQVD